MRKAAIKARRETPAAYCVVESEKSTIVAIRRLFEGLVGCEEAREPQKWVESSS